MHSNENKKRTVVWLYPETIEAIDATFQKDNCKSRSELVEKAADFYISYLSVKDTTPFLSKAVMSGVEGVIQNTENRIANNLFRLSVETDMLMHLTAANMKVGDEELRRLRARCVAEVKKTGGRIRLDDAMAFQHSGDE
jgi:metal-responsive CopG/Arc/MetJ family transcriptional regulator